MSAAVLERSDARSGAEIVGRARRGRARRTAIVVAACVLVLLVAAAGSLLAGASDLSPGKVLAAAFGFGDAGDVFIVQRLRLPRILAAILAGGALGLSGALFQTTLRNPLASPDLLGVSGGAAFGAVLALLVFKVDAGWVSAAAFAGALLVALLSWALAWRGGLQGYRFVLVGVGLGVLMQGLIGWMITRADVRTVSDALVWTVGGVGNASQDDLERTGILVGIALVGVIAISPRLPVLALGDESARGLGVRAGRDRAIVLGLAVLLVASAVSLAGPLAFVALMSAPIARRLVRNGGAALVAATAVGATLVVVADLVGSKLLPDGVPAGIVTGLIGAPYLLWLIAASNRKGVDG
ncbi:FecCD family ABC transporter permease [Agromyces seonyuensis]|uniref:Iron chelate uptake ABC transporter family permease subunit n=1 Tax=Agromyces seonyuensis TaxID=2662446 RepID=A0A6I4NX00_9MICO|nr:iron ABC transporter permease [Agromyces seonyuensis]MWB98813.1 iron chelate uptake ABC transporter family permease subunit [Agromyces seonyuensis]